MTFEVLFLSKFGKTYKRTKKDSLTNALFERIPKLLVHYKKIIMIKIAVLD